MAITVIDDRDPIIVYTGAWTAGGTRFESNFTAMITSEKGATATIEFVGQSLFCHTQDKSNNGLLGRNISVFATIPVLQAGQGRTTATFTLDDGASLPVTTFVADHHPNTTQYYIPMFRSSQLVEDRAHKLVMTHMSDNGGQITFDYMSVQGALTRYAVPEHGMSSTAKMAVMGGVLGGVILVLLGLVTALLLKQRRMTVRRAPVYGDHTGHSDAKSEF